MKKSKLFLLSLTMLLLCTACGALDMREIGSAGQPAIQESDSYDHGHKLLKASPYNQAIQIDNGMIYAIYVGVPYQYNPKNEKFTTVCQDPLCEHTGPLACGVKDEGESMVFHNNKCYYDDHRIQRVSNPETGTDVIDVYRFAQCYDISTASKTEYCEQCWALRNSICIGDYRYYPGYLDPENPEKSAKGIFRIHLPTDTHELLKEFPASEEVGVMYADDTYVYYNVGLDRYRMRLDDLSKSEKIFSMSWYSADYSEDDYIYANTTSENGECIIRISWDDFSIETMADGLSLDPLKTIRCTDNYIYYRSGESINIPGFMLPVPVGNFYRLSKAGGEPELVFEMTDELLEKYIPYYFIADGDYLYCICFKYDEDKQQYIPLWTSSGSEYSPELLRINIITKEYDIITPYGQ